MYKCQELANSVLSSTIPLAYPTGEHSYQFGPRQLNRGLCVDLNTSSCCPTEESEVSLFIVSFCRHTVCSADNHGLNAIATFLIKIYLIVTVPIACEVLIHENMGW